MSKILLSEVVVLFEPLKVVGIFENVASREFTRQNVIVQTGLCMSGID